MIFRGWLADLRGKLSLFARRRRKSYRPGPTHTESLEPRVVLSGVNAANDEYWLGEGSPKVYDVNGTFLGYKLDIYQNDGFDGPQLPMRSIIPGSGFHGSFVTVPQGTVIPDIETTVNTRNEFLIYAPPGPISGYTEDRF